MKIIYVFLVVIYTNFVECSSRNYNRVNLDGVIEFEYSKENSVYWIKAVRYYDASSMKKYRITTNSFWIEKIHQNCIDPFIDTIYKFVISLPNEKRHFLFSPSYRDQSSRGENPIHYGGDIYFKYDTTLTIAFNIVGEAIRLNNDNCNLKNAIIPNSKEGIIPCEYSEIDIDNELLMLIYYDKSWSLTTGQIKKMKLKVNPISSFPMIWCE